MGKGRGRRGRARGGRGERGGRRERNVITSASVFSMGPAEKTMQRRRGQHKNERMWNKNSDSFSNTISLSLSFPPSLPPSRSSNIWRGGKIRENLH